MSNLRNLDLISSSYAKRIFSQNNRTGLLRECGTKNVRMDCSHWSIMGSKNVLTKVFQSKDSFKSEDQDQDIKNFLDLFRYSGNSCRKQRLYYRTIIKAIFLRSVKHIKIWLAQRIFKSAMFGPLSSLSMILVVYDSSGLYHTLILWFYIYSTYRFF